MISAFDSSIIGLPMIRRAKRSLVEAPDVDSMTACHKAAHGLMPHEVIEVGAPKLAQFMGSPKTDENDRVTVEGQADTARSD